jgi:hypothetical protein
METSYCLPMLRMILRTASLPANVSEPPRRARDQQATLADADGLYLLSVTR